MSETILVSIGAILGANARFQLSYKLKILNFRKDFFILIINTFASFCLGLFVALSDQFGSLIYSQKLALFFSIGFLGSFSTFSSFIFDLFDLCLQFKFYRALKLFIISLSLPIISVALGFFLGSK
tara:strand:+ start:534 stop:908 length:375 start_codon:yes stop_codon:yes gene_type:complete